jgi:hypothetical protein
MKSEMTKTRLRRRTVVAASRSMAARLVMLPSGRTVADGLVSSWASRSTWVRPVPVGIIRWTRLS